MAKDLREMVEEFLSLPEEKKGDALKEIQQESYRIENMSYLLDDIRYAAKEAIGDKAKMLTEDDLMAIAERYDDRHDQSLSNLDQMIYFVEEKAKEKGLC